MFEEGNLLRFEPFLFKNGALPKPKYWVEYEEPALRNELEAMCFAKLAAMQNKINALNNKVDDDNQ